MSSYVGNRSNSPIVDFMLDTIEDRGYDSEDLDSVARDWTEAGGQEHFWDKVLGPAVDRLEEMLSEYGLVMVPKCDICGRKQGDSPWSSAADQPGDWNGETGNHRTCEDKET